MPVSEDLASTVQRLADIEEIKRLKAAYFRLLDTKQWGALGELFTDDATFSIAESVSQPRSREDFLRSVSDRLREAVTVHHGHMPEIEILDPTHAKGTWAMFDLVLAADTTPFGSFTGFGHYHEDYRKVDGRWRIASLQLTRLRRADVDDRVSR
jgi:hypothetical protein